MSSARQLINTVHVDMLIVPLRDEEDNHPHDVFLNARICGRFAFGAPCYLMQRKPLIWPTIPAYAIKSPANTTFNTIIFSIISVISWLFSVVIVY